MYSKLTPPDSEKEIQDKWLYTDRVYISILCITFNQDSYIKDAINSFLSQETKFKFEIIINNDCSTDSTANILEYYQQKYPNIIRVITPSANQYSNCPNQPFLNTVNESKGRYVSICEGDDYWISANKLQLQFDFMEKNTDCLICIHDASIEYLGENTNYRFSVSSIDKNIVDTILPFSYYAKSYKQLSPTASYFIRNNDYFKRITNDFLLAPCIDLYWEAMLGASNGFGFINKKLSVYRLGAINSVYNENNSIMKKVAFKRKVIEYLNYSLQFFTGSSYKIIKKKRDRMENNLMCFEVKIESQGAIYKLAKKILCRKKIMADDIKTLLVIIKERLKFK